MVIKFLVSQTHCYFFKVNVHMCMTAGALAKCTLHTAGSWIKLLHLVCFSTCHIWSSTRCCLTSSIPVVRPSFSLWAPAFVQHVLVLQVAWLLDFALFTFWNLIYCKWCSYQLYSCMGIILVGMGCCCRMVTHPLDQNSGHTPLK